MKTVNLCLHAGGHQVDRDELTAIHTPAATNSWQPIPHASLVDAVAGQLARAGFGIVGQQYALARDGARMFGLMQVEARLNDEQGDYGLIVGVRNSHDKSFPAALCLGSAVFVCDNLAFSGEIKLARKHTRWITRDLASLVHRAVDRLVVHRGLQDRRINAYRELELTDHHASDLIVRSYEAGVVGAQRIGNVIDEWRNPRHVEFQQGGKTGWRLFNAMTEALKGSDLAKLPTRTQLLHGLLDAECGLVIDAPALAT